MTKDSRHSELHELLKQTNRTYPSGLVMSSYTASFYEGVMIYAEALNRTLHENNGSKIIDKILNGTFFSEYNFGKFQLAYSGLLEQFLISELLPIDFSLFSHNILLVICLDS